MLHLFQLKIWLQIRLLLAAKVKGFFLDDCAPLSVITAQSHGQYLRLLPTATPSLGKMCTALTVVNNDVNVAIEGMDGLQLARYQYDEAE